MTRTRQLIFAGLTAFLLVFCPRGEALAAAGPENSVAMVQKGIDTRDLALVQRYLDVDGVIAKAVETVMKDGDTLRAIEKTSFPIATILAMGNTDQTGPILRDFLTSETKEYIRYGVVSGAFAGKVEEGAAAYRGVFRKAFRGEGKDRVLFKDAAVKAKSGVGATVSCILASGRKMRETPLELRVERQGDIWRIVELDNAASLVKKSMEKNK